MAVILMAKKPCCRTPNSPMMATSYISENLNMLELKQVTGMPYVIDHPLAETSHGLYTLASYSLDKSIYQKVPEPERLRRRKNVAFRRVCDASEIDESAEPLMALNCPKLCQLRLPRRSIEVPMATPGMSLGRKWNLSGSSSFPSSMTSMTHRPCIFMNVRS